MSVRVFSRDVTIDEIILRAKREKSVTFARIIGWELSASSPYVLVPNILRYTFNNLFIIYPLNGYFTISTISKTIRPFILPKLMSKQLFPAP